LGCWARDRNAQFSNAQFSLQFHEIASDVLQICNASLDYDIAGPGEIVDLLAKADHRVAKADQRDLRVA